LSSLKKKTIKAFSWDILGRIFIQGNSFIVSIFLARLLGPEQFGLIAMAMAFVSISSVFIDIGFSSALIQSQNNTQTTYSSIFFFNVFAGAVLTLITFLIAPLIGKFYGNPLVTDLVRWLSLVFVFNSFNRVQNTILNKELNFKALTLRTFVASIVSGTLGVICAYQDWGVYSLVVQTLSFGFFSTLLLWSTSTWKPSFHFSMDEVKRLIGFSVYAFLERILNNIFIRLDVLLLAKIFSPATVGFYSRSSTLVDQVTKYTSTSIIRVLFPVLSKVQDNQEEYEKIYFRMFSIISFLSYALSGLLYFIGSDVILMLFGNKWEASVPIFQILIIASCNIPLNSLMWNALMSKGKAKENFYYGILRKSVGLFPFIFAFYFDIWWFTVTWVVSKFIISFLNIIVLKKHSNLSISKHLYFLLNGLIILIPGFLIFEYLELNQFATRIIFAISYLLVYLLINWIIRNEGLIYIISTISTIKGAVNKRLLSKF